MVPFIDAEADVGKQRRAVYRHIHKRQYKCPPKAFLRRDHLKKQDQNHRADRVSIDSGQRAGQPLHLALCQSVFQIILCHRAEYHDHDGLHVFLEIGTYIVIDMNNKRKHQQERQHRENPQGFDVVCRYEALHMVVPFL